VYIYRTLEHPEKKNVQYSIVSIISISKVNKVKNKIIYLQINIY